MKRYIEYLSLVCLFAACQSYGMESEYKETYNPKHQRLMPSATDELKLPEAMEGLVVSNRALEHQSVDESKDTVMEVDTATAVQNPLQNMLVAQHVIHHEIKKIVDNIKRKHDPLQQLVVYDEKYEKALRDLLYDPNNVCGVEIPPELIQIILSYMSYIVRGECVKTLIGHTGSVNCLLLLTNGRLASNSNDNTIKIWNLTTSECLKILIGTQRFYTLSSPACEWSACFKFI